MGPPFYNDLYDFKDGAQNDIFVTSTNNAGQNQKRDTYQPSRFSRFWGNELHVCSLWISCRIMYAIAVSQPHAICLYYADK